MKRIVRRIIAAFISLLLVSLAVFALVSFSSGDSSAHVLAEDASPEAVQAYREAMGLDDPFFLRYLGFMRSFFSGRWGESVSGAAVSDLILHRIPVTLSLTLVSLVLSLLIALPLSLVPLKRRSASGMAVTAFAALSAACPLFLSSLLLIIVFSVLLGLFPVAGYIPLSRSLSGWLSSVFLPSLSLAILHSSLYIMVLRKALKEGMESKPALVYASFGMRRNAIARSAAARPALPVMTMLTAETLASSLAGSAVVETVFALPGAGSLLVDAALSRDVTLAGTIVLLCAVMTIILSLLSEAVVFLLDPRERRGK